MMLRRGKIRIPLRLASALLLCACFGIAPSAVEAGCSRHPFEKHDVSLLGLEELHSFGLVAEVAAQAAIPKEPISPCAGLRCSRETDDRSTSTVRIIELTVEWACLGIAEKTVESTSAALDSADPNRDASDPAERLVRPPR